MKKIKLLALGVIALLLLGGLILASCGPETNNCPTYKDNPKCGYHTDPSLSKNDKDCINGCINRQYYNLPGGPSTYTKINLGCQCHAS
jgi:hypothetical protein